MSATLVISIAGSLIMLLLGIIGFFVKRFMDNLDEQAKAQKQLSEVISKLQITMTGIHGTIITLQENSDLFREGCKERHDVIDKRLNAHSSKIEEAGKNIAIIETKVGLI